jgi:hypothetical protein
MDSAELNQEWPHWLRTQLLERKVGAAELAVVLRIDSNLVCAWLSGSAIPSPRALEFLAELFDCDSATLADRIARSSALTCPDQLREALGWLGAKAADL